MARLPRLYAPSVVQHVVQRPVSGRLLFGDVEDYAYFIRLLEAAIRAEAVALHAYVLLPGQVRLLLTPPAAGSVARVMQAIGRRYVPYQNRKSGWAGALWERRYRSTLIDADRFLLEAMRHLERLPVADACVATPEAWEWSSNAHHIGHAQQAFVADHAGYWALSDTPFERQASYRRFVERPVDEALALRIDRTVEMGWVLGDASFTEHLARSANRRVAPLRRGRPRKHDLSPIV